MEAPSIPKKIVRKKKRIFDRRSVFFSIAVLVMFSILIMLALTRGSVSGPGAAGHSTSGAVHWTSDKQKELALKLNSQGLKQQAVEAFEKYLAMADLAPKERANICYTTGKLYMELNKYEEAIRCFNEVEIAGPEGELESEIGTKIVSCLEHLGKEMDAQYALERRTTLDQSAVDKNKRGAVVAKIGNDEVTMGEINDAIQRLPEWQRSQFKDIEAKRKFAEQYVATEVLYRKAKRLNMDDDPEMRRQIYDATKQILVGKMIEEERGKVKIDASDVQLYYEAHKSDYVEKAKAKVSHILVDTEEKAKEILKQLTEAGKKFEEVAKAESKDDKTKDKGGEIPQWVTEGGSYIPGVGSSEGFSRAVFSTETGKICESPVKTDKGFHIIKVRDKRPERQKTFDEVKDQAERRYRSEKEQSAVQQLFQKALTAFPQQKVQMFYEAFQKKTPEKPKQEKAQSTEKEESKKAGEREGEKVGR